MDLQPVNRRLFLKQLGLSVPGAFFLPRFGIADDEKAAKQLEKLDAQFVKALTELAKTYDDKKIPDVIRSSRQEGMQDFNQSLCDLVKRGLVAEQAAMEASPNPEQLAMNLKGITLGSDRGSISG